MLGYMLHRRGKTLEKGWTFGGYDTIMRPEKIHTGAPE